MSSGIERPGLWSYFSFGSGTFRNSTTRRRASSGVRDSLGRIHDQLPFSESAIGRGGSSNGGPYNRKGGQMINAQVGKYVRVGGLLALIVFAFLYFSPNERARVEHYVEEHIPVGKQAAGLNIPSDPSITTEKCTKPYSRGKPLVQYALVVDAGSTGSRIHVYRFNNCGPTPELEDEVFEQTEPREGGSGLSSYDADAEGAAKSLDVLLDVAVGKVPKKLQGCTPITVKATAGLRKLGEEKSERILSAVRTRLETNYPFPLVSAEKGGVQVMDGKDEGVYAWITTNYLLGKIGGPDKTPTAAVFDLGGGSTQIVFEPTFRDAKDGGMPEQMAEGDHKYDINFGGRQFNLYQHSYLGYGLMEARLAVHRLVINQSLEQHGEDRTWLSQAVLNPCIIAGASREVDVELGDGHVLGASVKVTMTGPQDGSPAQCRALAEKALKKNAECKLAPCAFNGVHQPSIAKTFANNDLYLLSFFYDRTFELGMPESFTIRELQELAHKVCDGETGNNWDIFGTVPNAIKELRGRPEGCLDLSFMVSLLHHGYEMPMDREVKIAKKIKGKELGWCLGASLPLLQADSGWQCKITEHKE